MDIWTGLWLVEGATGRKRYWRRIRNSVALIIFSLKKWLAFGSDGGWWPVVVLLYSVYSPGLLLYCQQCRKRENKDHLSPAIAVASAGTADIYQTSTLDFFAYRILLWTEQWQISRTLASTLALYGCRAGDNCRSGCIWIWTVKWSDPLVDLLLLSYPLSLVFNPYPCERISEGGTHNGKCMLPAFWSFCLIFSLFLASQSGVRHASMGVLQQGFLLISNRYCKRRVWYHNLQVQYLAYSTRYFAEVLMSFW